MTLTPAALAASSCGSMVPGSMPEIRSMMSYLSRIASSTPCTHWLGWPWFSHSRTSSPTSAPAAFMRSMMPLRNGLPLLLGIDIIFLPAAQLLASNGSPGATNTGLAVYLTRFSLARARPSAASSESAGPARQPKATSAVSDVSMMRCFIVFSLSLPAKPSPLGQLAVNAYSLFAQLQVTCQSHEARNRHRSGAAPAAFCQALHMFARRHYCNAPAAGANGVIAAQF